MYDSSRNLQYVEFNKNDKPWRIFTTSILHDNSLVVDPTFDKIDDNNLIIESTTSDILFFVDNNKKIEFNGDTVFNNDVSFSNNITIENITTDNLTVKQDISVNGSLYLKNVSIQNMKEKLESLEISYNRLRLIAERFKIVI